MAKEQVGKERLRTSGIVRLQNGTAGEADWKAFVDSYGPVIYRFGEKHGLSEADAGKMLATPTTKVSTTGLTLMRTRERLLSIASLAESFNAVCMNRSRVTVRQQLVLALQRELDYPYGG